MRSIKIDPITRLEGHGRIDIFLDSEGEVANACFIVPELRGFEEFCRGRLAEDMPVITNRICGVCPEAHHMASVKALDMLFGVEPPPAAKKIRELLYMAFFVADHTTHFYALSGPDFIIGPDAPPSERNIFGVIKKVGNDVASQVIQCRKRNHQVIELIGGRGIHPSAGLPGGWSKSLSKIEQDEIIKRAQENIDFALYSLKVFDEIVLKNPVYLEMVTSEVYLHKTYYMGIVDSDNRSNFYDGMVRVIDPEGSEFIRFHPAQYSKHIAERVEQWSYLKFPYLRGVGWNGLTDGMDSGVYVASPLSRLNVSDSMATSRAQEHFEHMYETFECKRIKGRYQPVHHRLATHWARLIEMLYASERMLELASDPEIISPEVRSIPTAISGEGIGCVEAPRGTLIHHYKSDERAVLTGVNLIVGTTNNNAAISMSIKRAAQRLIGKGRKLDEGTLNKIEMAFRLYDPCLSCATHSVPGKMALVVNIRDSSGSLIESMSRL